MTERQQIIKSHTKCQLKRLKSGIENRRFWEISGIIRHHLCRVEKICPKYEFPGNVNSANQLSLKKWQKIEAVYYVILCDIELHPRFHWGGR